MKSPNIFIPRIKMTETYVIANAHSTIEYSMGHDKTLYLLSFYTTPHVRGHGFGSLLLEQLIRIARERGFHTILLDDMCDIPVEHNIYYKFGFQIKGMTHRGREVWKKWRPDSIIVGPERRLQL